MNDSKILDRAVEAFLTELKRQAKAGRRTFSSEGEKAYFDGFFDCRALVEAVLAASALHSEPAANDRLEGHDLVASLSNMLDQLDQLLEDGLATRPPDARAECNVPSPYPLRA